MLYSLNFRPDIIALTETRMSPNSRSAWVQTFQSITFSIPIHLLLQVVQLIREFRQERFWAKQPEVDFTFLSYNFGQSFG